MVSTSAAVGCAVGIPAGLVIIFVSALLIRQHMREKKEDKIAAEVPEEEFVPRQEKDDGDYLDSVPVLEGSTYVKQLHGESRFREETVRDANLTSSLV
ncbi:hypothetical protein KL905_004387 [Ogataea polymorpha]|uniref:Uncharacterized protein n=1 Tax=Ogataea polymorpha TaxID=460523 RepID=A0A9P8THJ8_9ASCO|nr:hypothetical protein KL937_004554 [Ogataea polymorpha]KAG7887145.1 hypothetical protein KL936_004666 [Ogataea polymorpha]KAG7891347.1 hypothetical protein KL908_004100 [Ogataea polymorpha]KAG7898068.1 hypothetical protein KL935_004621 [Ogataea polymorpha]KAG7900505.1 hypothetical protein KL907_004623 [Ogataea polymorpha]